MKPITLIISNEPAALPVLQSTATAFLRAIGAEGPLSLQIELVLEEVFTNIVHHGYLAGRVEPVHVTFGMDGQFLALTFRFKGIPFDNEQLRNVEASGTDDAMNDGGRGIGLRLISQLSDQLEYRNLGKDGQEIYFLRKIFVRDAAGADSAVTEENGEADGEPVPEPSDVRLRRMLPAEAPAVSKLAYFAYDYSYAYHHFYDPERVRLLNEERRLTSYVVDHRKQGIVGHFAIAPDDHSDLVEFCAGFMDPRFRGNGGMNAMAVHGIHEAKEMGAAGVFVVAVTTHHYSQKAALYMGMRESALLMSCVQPVVMCKIREELAARESFFYMPKLFDNTVRGPYYCPGHHRDMIEKICRNLETEAIWGEAEASPILPASGQMALKKDDYLSGHIFIQAYGGDTLARVRTTLRAWMLDRLETIYLYMPLCQPFTADFCASCEETGFFFSGLRIGQNGEDWLVLQYLNNQRYDYGLLKAATAFGTELIEYVRERDPAQNPGEIQR